MDSFSLRQGPWLDDIVGHDSADATRARLGIEVAGTMLTHHEDIWTGKAADEILVPHSVLAQWFVGSWWRLMCEPKPKHQGAFPDADWRMAHEIAGAGGGCVWPFIGFATDLTAMWVFSDLLPDSGKQSVRYTSSLASPARVRLDDFQSEIKRFVQRVVDHVRHRDCESELPTAWELLQEEIARPAYTAWREAEARLGYDAGEGPDDQIKQAMELEDRMGPAASAEILPAFGCLRFGEIQEIATGPGIPGMPPSHRGVAEEAADIIVEAPWRAGYATAKRLLKSEHVHAGRLETSRLAEWLGISMCELEHDGGSRGRVPAAVAVAVPGKGFRFHTRASHPLSRRFELARFVGDLALIAGQNDEWLAVTDLATWRQQFQRSFAAELLCPAEALRDHVDELEADEFASAADRFQVNEEVVRLQYENQIAPLTA